MGWVREVYRWFWNKSLKPEIEKFLRDEPEASAQVFIKKNPCYFQDVPYLESKVSKEFIKLMSCLENHTFVLFLLLTS